MERIEEIKELKRQRKRLESDISKLTKSADENPWEKDEKNYERV